MFRVLHSIDATSKGMLPVCLVYRQTAGKKRQQNCHGLGAKPAVLKIITTIKSDELSSVAAGAPITT